MSLGLQSTWFFRKSWRYAAWRLLFSALGRNLYHAVEKNENRICSFSPSTCMYKPPKSLVRRKNGPIDVAKLEGFTKLRHGQGGIQDMNPEEDKRIWNCNESSAYSADSDCVARYGHCAETHAINYFTNFCMEIVGASRSTALTLCGVLMWLESFGESSEFSYEWITGRENESDKQKTASLESFDLLFPVRHKFLKDQDGNPSRI